MVFFTTPLEQFDLYFSLTSRFYCFDYVFHFFGGVERCFLDFLFSFSVRNLHVELFGLVIIGFFIYRSVLNSTGLVNYPIYRINIASSFVNNMRCEYLPIYKKRNPYLPIFRTLFFFILYSNVIGLFPFHFTVTSHLSITFGFSLWFFLSFNLIGCLKYGVRMFALFLPSGVPVFLSGFLVVIEVISYLARVISLSVRLFANIMAGHTLLKILAIFSVTLLNGNNFYIIILRIFPILLIFAVLTLEIIIAFLQAYVFLTLLLIYIRDVLYVTAH